MQVSDQIIKVLDNLCEKFGLAIDWTSETVLPYVSTLMTHLISYEIWSSVANIVFAVFGMFACIVIFKRMINHTDDLGEIAVAIFVPVIVRRISNTNYGHYQVCNIP